jgi:hypothetical protein
VCVKLKKRKEQKEQEVVVMVFRFYSSICFEGLRKTTKNFSGPKFEPETSRTEIKTANHSVATFSSSIC